ncbi:MAG: aminotransferase class III-fold pyridoxal phosphate-dependent enzyme, partial [Alphaproteobacteria bacterium]|nr:aminotransferase class III-fold pyridoxal phosphate-dependent enzyme [Alphaproteobacteria bacterium]MDX5416967.1 aminotransferase class III-fold pyridoxal phosphate-dependent enzyme [Alphaproteobacteria bacterium]MDX5494368.1 aminotransferase class III-fold pyridoxal phosphate-dependent enzyme [Alphaproteobacteria bacterium]
MSLSNAAVRDIETVIHPYTNLDTFRTTGPMIIERGEGIYVFDNGGNKYIEGLSGLWCTSLGYNEKELMEAAAEQYRQIPFTHTFGGKSHERAAEAAERLKAIAPHAASKVLFCGSGSEANDQQVKLVWYYNNALGRTKKKKFISRIRGYHGVTVASASLTGLPANHRDFDLPMAGVIHTDCPHYYRYAEPGETEDEFTTRIAKNLEETIIREDPETVAAFIAEPIMGAGGVVVPPAGYFEKIQAVLKKYDVYFIADEVICGFGRTGNMFGSETFNMKPDSISVAKALSSAYFPIAAVTVGEEMYQAMIDESKKIGTFGHGFTYTAHPVGAAIAAKTLEIYEKRNIVGHVRSVQPAFEARVARLADHPLVGHTRACGLIGAVELVANKSDKRAFDPAAGIGAAVVAAAQRHGLILRALAGDIVAFCPPLIITGEQVNEMFDAVEKALD